MRGGQGGSLLGEMGKDPTTDRRGHLVEIFPPSELVVGAR